MNLKIKKEYEVILFDDFRYITIFEKFNLLISSDFFLFMREYPNLTFKGNVNVNVDGHNYTIFSFIHLLNLIEILTDNVYLEHINYFNLLKEIKILPFCTSLLPNITYFIGAGKDNLNVIYHYDINQNRITAIAKDIEDLFNNKIIYDDIEFG